MKTKHNNLYERWTGLDISIWQYAMIVFAIITLVLLFGIYRNTSTTTNTATLTGADNSLQEIINLEDQVLPKEGFMIPVSWGNTGAKLVDVGVIDAPRFEEIYAQRGGFSTTDEALLYEDDNKHIVINRNNAGTLLNLFWALGLANKNEILEAGPMVEERYGGDPSRFASTAGWSLSVGDPMDHYSQHSFITLTDEQQSRVKNVSQGIYRPCCGNSTHFPDCNHGMAMLGLLQLLAQEDISEEEMYKVALAVNSFWFPETYLTLATYFEQVGTKWEDVDAKIALGPDHSSGNGYQRVISELNSSPQQSGSSCGV